MSAAPETGSTEPARRLGLALWPLFAAWVGLLAWVGVSQRFDFWDGFEALLNARLVSGRGANLSVTYLPWRPPLLTLIHAPFQVFAQPCGRGLWVSHLVSVALAALAVVAGYRLFRHSFGDGLSALGAAVLAVNPLMVFYAPFVVADVPSMLCAGLAVWLWLEARKRGGWRLFVAAGVAGGLGVSSKFPVMFVLAGLGLFELLRVALPGPGRGALGARVRALFAPGPWLGAAVSALVFAVVWVGTVALALPRGQLTGAKLAEMVAKLSELSQEVYLDPWYEYLETLWLLLGVPAAVLAALGLVRALLRRADADLLHLCVVLIFVGMMSGWVRHKEARYVLPVLPSVVFFVLCGAEVVARRIRWPIARLAGAALLIAPPALGGARELRRFFTAPIYTQPVLTELVCYVHERVGSSGRWMVDGGRAWSLFSPEPVVFPHDEYMHFHHLSWLALQYLLVEPPVSALSPTVGPGVEVRVHFPYSWYETASARTLPGLPDPIRATSTRRERLELVSQGADTADYGTGAATVRLARVADGWAPAAIAPGARVLPGDGAPPRFVELVTTEERTFAFRAPSAEPPR